MNGKLSEDSLDSSTVIFFNFAQLVAVPHNADQANPIYFKVSIRAHIFGLMDEAKIGCSLFSFDEGHTMRAGGKTSHGPNAAIFCLHHDLILNGRNKKHVRFPFDNCTGQNKIFLGF